MNMVGAIDALQRMKKRLLAGQPIEPESAHEDRIGQLIDYIRSEADDQLAMSKEIVELQSTIAAQHDHIEDGAKALEQVNEENQSLLASNTGMWMLLNKKDARIAELEAQLAAALATIERAAWCEQCNLPAEHCRENHSGDFMESQYVGYHPGEKYNW